VHVERDAQGQIVADVSRLYQWSEQSAGNEPGSYVSLNEN
jgi:hypothetical protein